MNVFVCNNRLCFKYCLISRKDVESDFFKTQGSVPNTGRSIKSYMINFCIGTFLKLEWHLSILQRK